MFGVIMTDYNLKMYYPKLKLVSLFYRLLS